MILGPAYTLMHHYDVADPRGLSDCAGYLEIARGNWMQENALCRYRPIVPMLAGDLGGGMRHVADAAWQNRTLSEAECLHLGFLIVNSIFVALGIGLAYALCRSYGVAPMIAGIAILPLVTSWQMPAVAGTPLTDSFYFLMILLAMWGIRAQSTWATIIAIMLGPHAKETFVLLFPVIFFAGPLDKWDALGAFVASAIMVMSFRIGIDNNLGIPIQAEVISRCTYHWRMILENLGNALKLQKWIEVGMVFGVFNVILLVGLTGGGWRGIWAQLRIPILAIIPFSIIHLLLIGGGHARMLFDTGAAFFCPAIALILDRHPKFKTIRRKIQA